MASCPWKWIAALAALALAGCGAGKNTDANPDTSLVKSDKPRLSAASAPDADVHAQAHGDATFGFDLYAQLRGQPGNLFFSPHSISLALGMTWAGAAGDTATDMASALHFEMPADRVHAALNALDLTLATRAAVGTSRDGGPFKLNIANAIWAQHGLALQSSYLDTLAEDYGAGVRVEDFARAPDAALSDINGWVSDATAGKIPELLQSGDITPNTELVLTNAVYFNASWQTPFDEGRTQPADFHHLDGSTTQVPLMHEGLQTGYAAGNGWEVVELPYSNPALSLTVIVPAAGQFEAVESQLSADFLDAAVAAEQPAAVELSLPKFDAKTSAHLHDALAALGMGAAFSGAADFSGIDGQRDLFISDVVHQATVSVNEAGTEAAAATAVILAGNAAPGQVVTLTIDRPFIVALRDQPTGAVLFLGRISEP